MWVCRACHTTYAVEARFCVHDGAPLVDVRPMAEAAPRAPRVADAGEPPSEPLPGGRSWTARAALASGEITMAAVQAAEARAEAVRNAAPASAPRLRWTHGAGALALAAGVAVAVLWAGRAAPDRPTEAQYQAPSMAAGGGTATPSDALAPSETLATREPLEEREPLAEREVEVAYEPLASRETEAPRRRPALRQPAPVRTSRPEPPRPSSPPAPTARAAPSRPTAEASRSADRPAAPSASVVRRADELVVSVRSADGRLWPLAKTFTPSTTLSPLRFRSVDGRDVVVFSAADPRWTTHYVWAYASGELFWQAYDGRLGHVTTSPNVRPGSAVADVLRRPE